jgi:sugar phosphate isomerase/epimerase
MQRLGAKLVRIMSYAVLPDRGPEDQMFDERVKRVSELCRMFNDAGLTPVHENCMNYGGMGYTYTLRLIENIPGLKLVFDTGNPVFTDDRTKPLPYPKQSAWEFYENVKEHIAYVHIKDGLWDAAENKCVFTFAGEGDGDVKRIVKDLLDGGYNGGISMEPHIASVYHDPSATSDEQRKYNSYVEYGRRFMMLLKEIGYAG